MAAELLLSKDWAGLFMQPSSAESSVAALFSAGQSDVMCCLHGWKLVVWCCCSLRNRASLRNVGGVMGPCWSPGGTSPWFEGRVVYCMSSSALNTAHAPWHVKRVIRFLKLRAGAAVTWIHALYQNCKRYFLILLTRENGMEIEELSLHNYSHFKMLWP